MVDVRPARPADRAFVEATLVSSWGGVVVARRDELVDCSRLPALVAWLDGERAGALTYQTTAPDRAIGGQWEIVTIDALIPGRGVGTALLAAVRHEARRAGAARLWLITTNDNTHAIRFYQRNGFDLAALHRHGVTRARLLKPSIPLVHDGIALRHELEFAMVP